MYVAWMSPLVMLADYPEAYEGPGLEFIEKVPTVWDDTRVLDGAPGKYVVIARRKGDTWYIGAMTNWEPRYLSVPLSFLGTGSFELQEIADGPRADVDGTSIRTSTRRVTPRDSVPLQLGPGGGAAIVLRPSR
ncbi:MAG: glycoside hydrolase family 97 C-terminal domain-containing protein [Gemmatimonadaceae bacterium]